MNRQEIQELFVMLRTDPELRKQFRQMQVELLRDEVLPSVVSHTTGNQHGSAVVPKEAPPGMWSFEKAMAMTGCTRRYLYDGLYRAYFGGQAPYVVHAELIQHVMKRGVQRMKDTLVENLRKMEEARHHEVAKPTTGRRVRPFAHVVVPQLKLAM